MKPGLLILDEPTNHMNFRHLPVIAKALSEYEGAMILVSHVPEFVKQIRIDEVLDLAKKASQVQSGYVFYKITIYFGMNEKMPESSANNREGTEVINEGLLRLVTSEIERIANTVTKNDEWDANDAKVVLYALAKNGLKPDETLEAGILRGVMARVGSHTAGGTYVADKELRVTRVQGRGDTPDQAMQSRAA